MILLLLFLLKFEFILSNSYTCGDKVDKISNISSYALISSPNFPQNIDFNSRNNCHFMFEDIGGYSLVFTNGYLNDLVIIQDGIETLIKELDTNVYKQPFYGKTIGFKLSLDTTNNSNWQAFQAVVYNFVLFSSDNSANNIGIYIETNDTNDVIVPIIRPFNIFKDGHHCFYWNIFRQSSEPKYYKIDMRVQLAGDEYVVINYDKYNRKFNSSDNSDEFARYSITSIDASFMGIQYCSVKPMVESNNTFIAFISLGLKPYDYQTRCQITSIQPGLWTFTNYDEVNGYQNNQHCIEKITKTSNMQYAFWVEKFNIEEPFDFITAQTNLDFTIIDVNPNKTYLAPASDLYFEFYSDGNIVQAGFEVIIKQFECNCPSNIVLPCDYSVQTKTFCDSEENDISPHIFCYNKTGCVLSISPNTSCINSTDLVMINYKISHHYFNITNTGYRTTLLYNRYLFYYNRTNFLYNLFTINQNRFTTVIDSSDIWFLLNIYRKPEPTKIQYYLNDSLNSVYFTTEFLKNNSYFEIIIDEKMISNNYTLEILYTSNSSLYYGDYDIYDNEFGNFHKRLDDNSVEVYIQDGTPLSISLNSAKILIYSEYKSPKNNVHFYARIKELEKQSCMFNHNVVEAKYSFNITMVNNGTNNCKITVMNPYSTEETKVTLYNFWTTADKTPVRIYELNDFRNSIIEYVKNDKIGAFQLTENFYTIILPSKKSLMISCNVERFSIS